jgi:hypothetical protein
MHNLSMESEIKLLFRFIPIYVGGLLFPLFEISFNFKKKTRYKL